MTSPQGREVEYDRRYDVERYGASTVVAPIQVLAWSPAGPVGRDGFRETGRWRFGPGRSRPAPS